MASRPTSETSSKSSTSSAESAGDIRAHSAVHVVKGAVAKTFGPRRITSASSTEAGIGRLAIQLENKPTAQETADIEKAANGKVGDDAEFIEFEMEREEAEGHFGKGIHGFTSVREEGILLRMVRIPDWEASSCRRRHVQSTAEVGQLRFDRIQFDDSKKELELQFRPLR